MKPVFQEFRLGDNEATCTCWLFKDCVLHYAGTIKAPDGDSLIAACSLLECLDSEKELLSRFEGVDKILVAP
jgi:hypothetical protein